MSRFSRIMVFVAPSVACARRSWIPCDRPRYARLRTDRPEQLDRYTLLHHVGDVVGLLDALGTETAVIVGHDWGAPVAWYAALLRPDRFRGVIGLSVPFIPRPPVRPTSIMPQTADAQFFQLYFQSPGVAEAELERDVRLSIRGFLYSASGEGRDDAARDGREIDMVPRRGGFLSPLTNPASLPHWLTEADVDFYVSEFARTGFRGGLNWYRNMDRNWELLAPVSGVQVTVPALYIAGDRDLVLAFRGMDQVVANLSKVVPQLRRTLLLPGCGHWTQQERAQEVNLAMLDFVRRL
jgi:pimeloyl-ACP methyl ester carboxylesterase